MAKKLLIGLCALIVLAAGFLVKTIYDAGQFRTLRPHSDYRCLKVKLPCPEDIEIDAEGGMALISSSDRRAAMRGETTQGGIYGYSLRANNPVPVNLTADFRKEFHPHGISLYRDPSGRRYLFVINMGHDAHFFDAAKKNHVEIFEYAGGRLIHRETVSGDLLQTPNDILGVGPRRFYFTNDHGAESPLGKKLETYLQLALSNIVYYDGRGFSIAAGDLVYANGLAMSGDGKRVYATSTVGKLMRLYDRDAATGRLTEVRDVPLDTGVDNINIDAQGRIWAGCMPKLLSFVSYTKDPSRLAPSQVLTISRDAAGEYTVREVYLDSGEGISGCSSAAALGDRMLVGASYDDHFLDCTLGR
ncbi:MAG: SMP-30/gluconolactonase/LRE family protein [Spirochaetes bacterium]|nr:SMP-30/gluconolactonase/LRE family protein [Spirochaetota bacterium]